MKTGINPSILTEEIQNYINANLTADLHYLLLKKSPFPDVSMHEIAQQIKGKKVAQKKFPFLLLDGIIFPPNLNLEQAASQSTAEYKAKNLKGKSFLDMFAGSGIMGLEALSRGFESVLALEKNSKVAKILKENYKKLPQNKKLLK